MDEPRLRVGLAPGVDTAVIRVEGDHVLWVDGVSTGEGVADGAKLLAQVRAGALLLDGGGRGWTAAQRLALRPVDEEHAAFWLLGMTVGVAFHWEHAEDLRFGGACSLELRDGAVGEARLDVVDEVPLEQYLVSVISSEMSARCPPAMLRAHAVISRSWLIAQLQGKGGVTSPPPEPARDGDTLRFERWYDREDHAHFDVCADDHCQRYQGLTRAFSDAAVAAVRQTRGLVLIHEGAVCDARFSKCCGGMTELFSSAWGDADPAYLQAFPDGPPSAFELPLTVERHCETFLRGAPPAWCNTDDRELLQRVLPELDHDTTDFYRWEQFITQEQLRELLRAKGGLDVGPIRTLRPLRRGPSGRLISLAIEGLEGTIEIGKELEIRRLLSPSHLYSSAFIVDPQGDCDGVPEAFLLRGGGWGHGVGLCQIGAAVMADSGYGHESILAHYYRGATLENQYD
jgi:SpoIID/LytB domain protein